MKSVGFHPWIDIPFAVCICCLLVYLIKRWTKSKEPSYFDYDERLQQRIAVRSSSLVVIITLICFFADVSLFWVLIVAASVLLLVAGIRILFITDVIYGSVLAIGLLTRDFIVGHSQFVLPTYRNAPGFSGEDPSTLIGKRATTTTPLRPFGKIAIDFDSFDAVAEDQEYIDSECHVQIIELVNGTFVVRKDSK
jgi:membrane-bound ClpP family serine protease